MDAAVGEGGGTAAATRLATGIDFAAEGKQRDFLRLPHSVNRSAYGWLPVPLASIRNGEGPSVLLMSGVHGDEFEGQVALTDLIRDLEPRDVTGQLVILPMANYPAAKAGTRVSPIDDLNLNRVFPGRADGRPTEQLAHYIETVLMAQADYAFDLHSGGSSLHYLPTAVMEWSEDSAWRARQRELAQAFGAPHACFFAADHGGGSSLAAAARQGVTSMTFEVGGSGSSSPPSLAACARGVRGLLRHLGVLSEAEQPAAPPRVLAALSEAAFVYAADDGLFAPAVELGDEVKAGDLAGRLLRPETPWAEAQEVRFEADGLVLCKRVPGRAERGDCLFHLGCPVDA